MAADPLTQNTVTDLLNYDVSDEDIPFRDVNQSLQVRDDKPTLSPRAIKRNADDDKEKDVLGLDEEVKVTKKRKAIAKLDENRLLSQPGIPKLRALVRSRQIAKKLHFNGRGHEFSDAAKLLNYYQLWLDNLYPRAKFADALQLVEKAGHSKRMQTMRKEWIDEGKPGKARREYTVNRDGGSFESGEGMNTTEDTGIRPTESSGEELAPRATDQPISNNDPESEDLFFPDSTERRGATGDDDATPAEDELDALLAEQEALFVSQAKPTEPASADDDDLEALLAEHESRPSRLYSRTKNNALQDRHEDDDLDAIQTQGDTSQRHLVGAQSRELAEDEDDLDALLAERESRGFDGDGAAAAAPAPAADAADAVLPLRTIDDGDNSSLAT